MRLRRVFFAVIPALFLGPGTSSAQTYPSRTITAIIPFAAGNANDITARVVFEQLSKQLGQTIVIESRPGAGGTIGVGQAARAAPDGYTILFHSATFSASYVTHKTLPYDTLTDFIPVSAVGISPSVLVAAPSKGFKTAADLIVAAKAKPGELNFASAGIGAASHLAAEKFRIAAGIKAQHVPFKGPVEALTEVMAGRIDYYFLPIAPALNNIKSGTVTALAVVLRQARAAASGCSHHGRDRAAGRRLRVLERRVRAGKDATRRGRPALPGNPEGDRRSGREGTAGEARHRTAADVAAGVRALLQGRRARH